MRDDEQRALLSIARAAVARAADGRSAPPDEPDTPELRADGAAFVTLHCADGALRGCVGTTAAMRPLYETVHDMATAAATRDPRFEPVATGEVDKLSIEISVLNPLERIHSIDEVQIGKHGLVVEGRGRRGLLLPQVASERGWDGQTFAAHTCQKAGLPPDAFVADDVVLHRFSTDVFAE